MRMSEKELEEILEKGNAKVRSGAAVPLTNVESDTSDGRALAKKETPRFLAPVNILVHSFRRRLADSDGISAKAVIDGIVKEGILVDDSARWVTEVRYKQTKIKAPEQEKTIITIEIV